MSSNFLVPNSVGLFPFAPCKLEGGITQEGPQGEGSDFKQLIESLRRSPDSGQNQSLLGPLSFSPFKLYELSTDQQLPYEQLSFLFSRLKFDFIFSQGQNSVQIDQNGYCHLPIKLNLTSDKSLQIPGQNAETVSNQDAELIFNLKNLTNQIVNQDTNSAQIDIPAELVIKIDNGNDGNADLYNLLNSFVIAKRGNGLVSQDGASLVNQQNSQQNSNSSTRFVVLPVMLDGQLKIEGDAQSIQIQDLTSQLQELKGELKIRTEAALQPKINEDNSLEYKNNSKIESKENQLDLKSNVLEINKQNKFADFGQSKNSYSQDLKPPLDSSGAQSNQVVNKNTIEIGKDFLSKISSEFDKNTNEKSQAEKMWLGDLGVKNNDDNLLKIDNTRFGRNPSLDISKIEDLARNVISQIRSSIFDLKDNYRSEARIKLEPESLGSIKIHLVTEDSSVSARIVVDNLTTKQIVQANLNQLKESLSQQGLNLEKCDISLGEDNKGNSYDNKPWNSPNWGKKSYNFTGLKAEFYKDAPFASWGNSYMLSYLA